MERLIWQIRLDRFLYQYTVDLIFTKFLKSGLTNRRQIVSACIVADGVHLITLPREGRYVGIRLAILSRTLHLIHFIDLNDRSGF
ncbi:MAG: hypothetical protein AAFY83_08370 [Pseudomonadota bacterium]